jgi:hypothetical protein
MMSDQPPARLDDGDELERTLAASLETVQL